MRRECTTIRFCFWRAVRFVSQKSLDIAQLRRYAIARSLFKPTNLGAAIRRLGFVQADPMRAPARAQDLILRHRVRDYRAGELERRYARLGVEEDCFVNYGFLPRDVLPSIATSAGASGRSCAAHDMKQSENSSGSIRLSRIRSQRDPGMP